MDSNIKAGASYAEYSAATGQHNTTKNTALNRNGFFHNRAVKIVSMVNFLVNQLSNVRSQLAILTQRIVTNVETEKSASDPKKNAHSTLNIASSKAPSEPISEQQPHSNHLSQNTLPETSIDSNDEEESENEDVFLDALTGEEPKQTLESKKPSQNTLPETSIDSNDEEEDKFFDALTGEVPKQALESENPNQEPLPEVGIDSDVENEDEEQDEFFDAVESFAGESVDNQQGNNTLNRNDKGAPAKPTLEPPKTTDQTIEQVGGQSSKHSEKAKAGLIKQIKNRCSAPFTLVAKSWQKLPKETQEKHAKIFQDCCHLGGKYLREYIITSGPIAYYQLTCWLLGLPPSEAVISGVALSDELATLKYYGM